MTRWWGAARSALLLAALLPAACMRSFEFDPPGGSGGGAPGNGGSGGVDGGSLDAPSENRGAPHCSGGAVFGSLNVKREVPSIMFALDRSPSMKTGLGGTTGSNQTRFSVTAKAITDSVSFYSSLAQFGYVEFPGTQNDGSCSGPGSGCCAGGLVAITPVGPSAANAISNKLGMCTGNSFNNCVQTDATPTGQALKKSATNLQGLGSWLYVILLTDGGPSPSCPLDPMSADSACEQTVHQISSMASASTSSTSIATFVVAIGDIAPDGCLSDMASASGHTASPTAPFYFTAPTDSAVHSQIDSLVASMNCQFDITDSFDPTRPVEVDFNNPTILPDPTRTNGWDLDKGAGHITVYGPACLTLIQGLKSSSSHQLSVKGCPDSSHPFQQPNP